MTRAVLFLAALAVTRISLAQDSADEPPAYGEAPDGFLVSPHIKMELWAAEPQVIDPVALAFSANGDCYVVEMRDYPYGIGQDHQPGGTIRLLQDKDGDGKPETSTLFAQGLSFPTSVTCWKKGILVAAPPEVLYLEDTNQDGKSDVRKVVLAGFRRGVTDSNFNSLRWGPDGKVHGVNGGNGGNITSPLADKSPALALGKYDFSFDPDSGRVEKTYQTGGGFGLAIDSFGRRFTTYNINYLQQQILSHPVTQGRPDLAGLGPLTVSISAQGEMARIFPVVEAQSRPNHPEQAGYFSSACGTALLDGGLFGPELTASVFTCDPASSIVHRDVLKVAGPLFRGERPADEKDREFIASREAAFRPTSLEQGPDGALYLTDMQRDVIEHPDYIPAKLRDKLSLRAGDDRGRIYRLVPAKTPLPKPERVADPLAALASPIAWARLTGQRLLIERRQTDDVAKVRQLAAKSPLPECRVLALWTLEALGSLDDVDLATAMADSHPGVRENAASLSARHPDWTKARALALTLTADTNPQVRFQAALATSGPAGLSSLAKLWATDQNPWTRKAIVVAAGESAADLALAIKDPDQHLARAAMVLSEDVSKLQKLPATAEVLTGLAEGVPLRTTSCPPEVGRKLLESLGAKLTLDTASPFADLVNALKAKSPATLLALQSTAAQIVAGKEKGNRAQAIQLVARGDNPEPLLRLLGDLEPSEIQQLAADALARRKEPTLGTELVQRWRSIKPAIRPSVIRTLIDHHAWHDALLSALEKGQILRSELNLDLEQRRELLRESEGTIPERAKKFFGDEEYSNRKETIAKLLEELPPEGNIPDGSELYRQRCLMCHVHGSLGNPVGPDLTGVSHRSAEDLITHIVDPNFSINPGYVVCEVVTRKGEKFMGILRQETDEAVVLLKALAMKEVIPRKDIQSIRTLDKSLMPEGLESGMSPFDLRSLVQYLQSK